MSKVERGVRLPPPPPLKASCNYFFQKASRVNVAKGLGDVLLILRCGTCYRSACMKLRARWMTISIVTRISKAMKFIFCNIDVFFKTATSTCTHVIWSLRFHHALNVDSYDQHPCGIISANLIQYYHIWSFDVRLTSSLTLAKRNHRINYV